MGILTGLFEQRATLGQSFKVSQTPPGYVEKWGAGWESTAGVHVTVDTAMQSSAVLCCIRILSEVTASLPLILYERLDPRGKERAVDYPLYPILHDMPNPEMTSYKYREMEMSNLAKYGNSFSEIEWSNGGQVLALWPLVPGKMENIKRENGRLAYYYRLPDIVSGELKRLDMGNILHVRGLGSNGIVGYSPIQLARNAIGLGMATEEFGSRFFSDGAMPGGVLEHPNALSDKAYERLDKWWGKRHEGLEHSHRLAILEEGMKYNKLSVPPEDAQFLETRKFQLAEIARMFRVPLHMLNELDRATFSNIEHLSLEFVIYTLGPWLVNWEQEIYRSLLSPTERKTLFAEHLVAGLLRGDLKSRYEAYNQGHNGGWLSADDIREMENMNPIEGGGGQTYLMPLNMVPVGQPVEPEPPKPKPSREKRGLHANASTGSIEERGRRAARKRRKLIEVYQNLYQQTSERVLRREIGDLKSAAKKYLTKNQVKQFNIWLSEYYEGHEEFVKTAFGPVNESYGLVVGEAAASEIDLDGDPKEMLSSFLLGYLIVFAARHVGTSVSMTRDALQKALDNEIDLLQAIDEMAEHWLEVRPGTIADEESVRLNNAAAKEAYKRGGITKLQWVSFGENCPYCDDLDGKIVGIEENFLDADTDFQPEGAERPLRTASNIGHAPAHSGCDCMVAAA